MISHGLKDAYLLLHTLFQSGPDHQGLLPEMDYYYRGRLLTRTGGLLRNIS